MIGLNPAERMDRRFKNHLRRFFCNLFDFHAAQRRKYDHRPLCHAVQQYGKVKFLYDLCLFHDHNAVYRVPLDIHADYFPRAFYQLRLILCKFDAAGFAAAACHYLRFDDNRIGKLCGRPDQLRVSARESLLSDVREFLHGKTARREKLFCLVFH